MNEANSERNFDNLLKKAVTESLTPEEEELFYKFFDDEQDSKAKFNYNKRAAEAGYRFSFYSLGRAYILGEGCEPSFEKGLFWLKKSIESECDGNTLLGDCYRLGIGTDKNYEIAWEYYSHVKEAELDETEDDHRVFDLKSPDTYLDDIPIDWWEFVMTKIRDDADCFAEMACFYKKDSERWLYWTKKAAEAGNILSMGYLLERLSTQEERNKYVEEIIDIAPAYDEAFHYIGVKVLKGDYPPKTKEKVVSKMVLYEYEKEDKELMEEYYCFVDFDDGYVSPSDRGMVVCPFCHHKIPQDDIDDPDKQGEVCNDCYYSCRYLEEED